MLITYRTNPVRGEFMKKHTSIAAVLAVLFTMSANAMDCPVKVTDGDFDGTQYTDQVTALIAKKKSCADAKELAEACAFGSSIDGVIVSEALVVCDKNINGNLKAPILKAKNQKTKAAAQAKAANTLKTYANTRDLCDSKYAEVEGTIGVSVRSFCYLDVAYLFSNLTEKSSVGAQD